MQRKIASLVVALALFGMTTYALAASQPIQGSNYGITASSTVGEKHNVRPMARPHYSTSVDWSGYAVVTDTANPASGAVTDVVGEWTVPSVSASMATSFSAVWVGIDGYTSSTIQQIGTGQDIQGGIPQYYAWYELAPDPPNLIDMAVSPGDSISAAVHYLGANQFSLVLNNLTTGDSFSTTETVAAARQSTEWVVEAPSSATRVLPLANFGSVTFSGAQATLNGHSGSISDANWQFDPITMVNRTGVASPSSLFSGGSGFRVSWGAGGAGSVQTGPTTATGASESTDKTNPTATAKPTRKATATSGVRATRTAVPTPAGH